MFRFQTSVIYERIKAYAPEHVGLKTSSLYVSLVERKCGIEVEHKYNRVKKKTQKKVTIKKALKHFQIILGVDTISLTLRKT